MNKNMLLVCVVLLGACGLKLVKDEKYIETGGFKDSAYRFCLDSRKYQQQSMPDRQATCRGEADQFIAQAERKFRDYKADEHNYRLCRSKFADINASDKCFREQQEKYYQRELGIYKGLMPK